MRNPAKCRLFAAVAVTFVVFAGPTPTAAAASPSDAPESSLWNWRKMIVEGH